MRGKKAVTSGKTEIDDVYTAWTVSKTGKQIDGQSGQINPAHHSAGEGGETIGRSKPPKHIQHDHIRGACADIQKGR